MKILSVPHVESILNTIYTDYSIAYVGRNFSNAFLRWNSLFCNEITTAISSRSTSFVGSSCNLDIEYALDVTGVLMATILRCDINMHLIRSVERQSNAERIQRGLRSVPPTTFTSMPTVAVSKSPRFTWTPPSRMKIILPKEIEVFDDVYYNGFKVGYYNGKYIIIDKDGNPTSDTWLNEKPKFFKRPFGSLHIIAHVSINGYLYSMDVNGKYYSMQKKWSDVYLKESYQILLNTIITETINSYLRNNLLLAS